MLEIDPKLLERYITNGIDSRKSIAVREITDDVLPLLFVQL